MADTDGADSRFAHMTLVDWLDDLTVRFLLNLPPAELSSVPRLCFQVEEAQWFYEDFIRPANPTLPSLNLRQFLLTLFQHCPLLSGFDATQHVAAYEEFLSYKVRVPVRGAILMDETMEKVLLVRGWKKGSSWSFPRGKINKDEKDLDCAVREVYEETGYDVAAAGLVQSTEQDGQVKAIDITMREQHMKLFVFRGVPLDTYFEPRTRKEISKIQWYNVKDLPGFKKQRGLAGQGQGDAATSKFYMVAPFLGHLKKWIGQQRRVDHAAAQSRHSRSLSANNELLTGTEDEVDTEQEFATDNGLGKHDQSADELKRLLSIGEASAASQPLSVEAQPSQQTNNLLAMLRGPQPPLAAGNVPLAPMDQIGSAFSHPLPETPQPHHPRHPSMGIQQTQQVPQFPYSSDRLQLEQQLNHSLPDSNGAWQHTAPHASNAAASIPIHMQQQFQHHAGYATHPTFQTNQNIRPDQFESRQSHQAGDQNQGWQHFTDLAASAASTHAPGLPQYIDNQKPLGSSQSMPEASKLPLPKLNEHSLNLLNAFKGTGSATIQNPTPNPLDLRTGSQQQMALLDLFKRPSDSAIPSIGSREAPITAAPTSPALTDVTVKPAKPAPPRRTSTLNEITRTLPPKLKGKSPAPTRALDQPIQMQQLESTAQAGSDEISEGRPASRSQRSIHVISTADAMAERPKSRGQLYDPNHPQKFVRAPSQVERAETETAKPSSFAAKAASRPGPRTPNVLANPRLRGQNSQDTTNVVPQFSILQRPPSSAGHEGQVAAPQSPLRQVSTQPGLVSQVLKRADAAVGPPSNVSEATDTGNGKKGHLLSLFGKVQSPIPSTAPKPAQLPEAQATLPARQQNTLLELFNGSGSAPIPLKTPEPPSAPRLEPERKPSNQGQQLPRQSVGLAQTSQQTLLNLFNKSGTASLTSPGTPISPFMLNSPLGSGPPSIKLSMQASEPRSRIGSMASVVSNGPTSGQQTPKSATPTAENKGFMLDYLNGVVQKEGHRGAKKQ